MEAYLIFGMGPAGLFLARQLKNHETKAIVAIGKKDDIGRYSNTLVKYYATEDAVGIKNAVQDTLRRYSNVIPYICSDQYLSIFVEQWPEIFTLLSFTAPSPEILKLFSDKESVMKYCKDLGIRVPRSKLLSVVNYEDIALAIKPLVKRGISKMGKITIIRNKTELEIYKNNVIQLQENLDDFIVQPYIAGDNKFEYGYGGYFRDGKALVDIYFYQLRQYPQGVSCYTLEITDPQKVEEIHNIVKPFIKNTKYTGFLQFDIKEDEKTGLLYVLDINPRPWGSVSMLTNKLKHSGNLWETDECSKPCCWHFPMKELFSLHNPLNVSYSNIRKMKNGVKYSKFIDLYDRHDLKPFFMQPIIALKKLFK